MFNIYMIANVLDINAFATVHVAVNVGVNHSTELSIILQSTGLMNLIVYNTYIIII